MKVKAVTIDKLKKENDVPCLENIKSGMQRGGTKHNKADVT